MTQLTCPPGEHGVDFTYRGLHQLVCSPDVPGAGLPWDMPTVVSSVAVLVVLGSFVGYLIWLQVTGG